MSEVVNFKRYGSVMALNQAFGDRWVYIGRANSYAGLVQSPLANPFKVRDYGGQRGAAIDDYRHWLWGRILSGDTAVSAALRAISEETALVCWCKPGPCHGDVVQAAARWLKRQTGQILFVSGHRDLLPAEFGQHYVPKLDAAIAEGHCFVVGDAPGADAMAQAYLAHRVSPERVTVYHAGRRPCHCAEGFAVRGGYANQAAKDAAMTAVSDDDIAWVRLGRETSGTACNLARRALVR